jgi:serine/threonine protein kinase
MLIHRQKGTGYGPEIDWWALGIVIYELLLGHPPFFDRDFTKMCTKIMTRPIRFPTINGQATLPTDQSIESRSVETNAAQSSSKHSISLVAQSLILGLLQREYHQRLCCGRRPEQTNYGIQSLQRHAFYSDINWLLLENNDPKQDGSNYIPPPFSPSFGRDPDDTRNFDKEFTRMVVKDSPPDNDRNIVSEDLFPGFSFSSPNLFHTQPTPTVNLDKSPVRSPINRDLLESTISSGDVSPIREGDISPSAQYLEELEKLDREFLEAAKISVSPKRSR